MTLQPGAIVGGYTIESVLGSGGMGTVYRARHPALPRSDALKVLSAELSRDEHFRSRFEREAELAATLDHPNIVTVYNRGDTDGQLWIAMQYVAGSDAEKELAAGRMTPRRAVHIIGEVAGALDYAHRRQLLHRDAKPANFLLAPHDERIFLADFGIARALDDAVNLTQTGMVMASIAYAAPESLAGEAVDHRADVYSLGCSLYRLLTGQAPFARPGGMAAVAAAHLMDPPPRPTDAVPSLPTALDAVIARAMAKEPAQRFQSAGELAAAAHRALDDSTDAVAITTTPTPAALGPPDRTPPHWPTQPSPLTRSTGPAPQHSQPWLSSPYTFVDLPAPTPRRRHRRTLIAAVLAAVVVLVAGAVTFWAWPRDTATAYTPQTFIHEHGQTTLTEAPGTVVAAGPGDADAVLSLGVQPAAIVSPAGPAPSYLTDRITGDVRVLDTADPAAIAATRPDLIIDTATMNAPTYQDLSNIATTITRPQNANDWTWQTQIEWIARILGRGDQAKHLIDQATTSQAELRTSHPAFDGKSVQAVLVTDNGVQVASATSPSALYLQGLGFRYADQPATTGTDSLLAVTDPAQLNNPPTDVRLVLRRDRAAGGGSYNGLSEPFTQYTGTTIIVDDPATIDALLTPGYAATSYLNTTLVDALTRQIR